MPTVRRVVFQPAAYKGMQRGINKMVNLLRPTLGPTPCVVAIDRLTRTQMPELLDNGGVLARRMIELPDRDEDMGAMFTRNLIWRLHETVGDGTATAAVLFQAIYNRGLRYIAAGGNPMQIRRHLEHGMQVVLDTLSGMV